MRGMIAAVTLMAAMTSASADEPNTQQANLIRHLVTANLLVNLCPGTRINESEMNALLAYYEIPRDAFSATGRFHDAAVAATRKAKEDGAKLTTYQACAAATAMFGPSGGNVPNLIVQRK